MKLTCFPNYFLAHVLFLYYASTLIGDKSFSFCWAGEVKSLKFSAIIILWEKFAAALTLMSPKMDHHIPQCRIWLSSLLFSQTQNMMYDLVLELQHRSEQLDRRIVALEEKLDSILRDVQSLPVVLSQAITKLQKDFLDDLACRVHFLSSSLSSECCSVPARQLPQGPTTPGTPYSSEAWHCSLLFSLQLFSCWEWFPPHAHSCLSSVLQQFNSVTHVHPWELQLPMKREVPQAEDSRGRGEQYSFISFPKFTVGPGTGYSPTVWGTSVPLFS